MDDPTVPNEVCITSYTLEGEITGVDLMSLEDLQEVGVIIPKGIYTTAYMTPMTRH